MIVIEAPNRSTFHRCALSYEPGEKLPVNAGASAFVLLAWLPEAEMEVVIAQTSFKAFTRNTITTSAAVKRKLRETERLVYAVSRGELDLDVVGVAAPIRDATDRVVAAISVAASASRIAREDFQISERPSSARPS